MRKLTEEQREVQRFRAYHPYFNESPGNTKIINDYLRAHGLATTLENLQAAFYAEYLRLDHSDAPIPTPAPKPAAVVSPPAPAPPAEPKVLPPWEKKYGRVLDADMVRAIGFEEMRTYFRDPRFGGRFKAELDALELTRRDLGW
jgi:hypothetical protein